MAYYTVLAFAAAMFIFALTPGPGVFATVSKALGSGFRHTVPMIAGIVTGDLLYLLLAIFGLSAIAATFSLLFSFIKYAGAAYLIWLGISAWRAAPQALEQSPAVSSGHSSYLAGLAITLGNPKVIIFYLAFLPGFTDLQNLNAADVIIIMLVLAVVLSAVMLGYAFAAARLRVLATSIAARRCMNRVAGSVMLGAGTLILARS